MDPRKTSLEERLIAVRERTLWLFDQVPDEFLRQRVHNFYSPIGWHFGHVGRTEEFWVCQALDKKPHDEHLSFMYADLEENPKDNRVHIPERAGALEYLQKTREFVLKALEKTDLDSENLLIKDGYAWNFAIEHECQHQETISEMLCLIQKATNIATEVTPFAAVRKEPDWLFIPGGTFKMGTNHPLTYDNEQRRHRVDIAPFQLAKYPVTSAEWLAFIEDGGYQNRELWSEVGWAWREKEGATAPEYWTRVGDTYGIIGASGLRSIDPNEPATSLSWFEAEAYAKYAGGRLPTETEWEFAASGLVKREYPWGDVQAVQGDEEAREGALARHGLHGLGPSEVGCHPKGASPFGVEDMAGNCWEWTSSPFKPYPGFTAFPYAGYSEDHMKGEHRVCRGGSWATAAPLLRCTFRNWYVPTYRQGFLGLRLAG